MGLDINLKKLKKNAFRYSKVRGETASRVRIPGGVIDAKAMVRVTEIAEKYGNGTIFITNRQGVEIPGIKMEDMDSSSLSMRPASTRRSTRAAIPQPAPETSSPAPASASVPSAAMTPPTLPARWTSSSTPTTCT